MLVASIFSFSHNVFYLFYFYLSRDNFLYLINIKYATYSFLQRNKSTILHFISRLFQFHHCSQCTHHAFFKFLLSAKCTIFFPSHWLLSHVKMTETKVSSKIGMNLLKMTIINPERKFGPAEDQTRYPMDPVLNSKTTVLLNPFPNKPWLLRVCSKSLENTVGKGEIACNEQFLLFPHNFLFIWMDFLPFSSNLKLLAAYSFNLEESKICRLGKG